MAGGRYDGLVEQMGGPPTPAVGWAAGIERLSMLLADAGAARRPPSRSSRWATVRRRRPPPCCGILRQAGVRAEMAYRGNLKRRMERANRIGARAADHPRCSDEAARGVVQLKHLDTGAQEEVAIDSLAARLR